jgi:hypothetical protein
MNKEFVPYEEALALKELGFNEPCFSFWLKTPLSKKGEFMGLLKTAINSNNSNFDVSAPLYQQAFRWFREKYKLYHTINHLPHKKGTNEEFLCEANVSEHSYHSIYEEAELACLRKLIKIVNQNKDE